MPTPTLSVLLRRGGAAALVVGAVLAARPAMAGVKAHLECAHDGKPLPASGKLVLEKPVACTIVIDKGAVPKDAAATITVASVTPTGNVPVQRVADPITAARSDHKAAFAPIAPFVAGSDYMKCAGVRFDAAIVSGKTTVWKGAVESKPACTDVKAQTGELTCIGMYNGEPFEYPGSGDTKKPKLDQAGITCTVKVKGTGDTPQFVLFNVDGSGKAPLARSLTHDSKFPEPRAFAQIVQPTLPVCKASTVRAAMLRQDGATLWTATLKIPQVCK